MVTTETHLELFLSLLSGDEVFYCYLSRHEPSFGHDREVDVHGTYSIATGEEIMREREDREKVSVCLVRCN